MTLNPFAGITDALKRRLLESFARGTGRTAAGALMTHGWVTATGAAKVEEIVAGAALWAVNEYFSQQSVRHTDKSIDVALESAPGTPRAVIDAKARQPSYVGGTSN